MQQQQAYYQSLSEKKRYALGLEEERNENLLRALMSLEADFTNKGLNPENGGPVIQTAPTPSDSPKR